MPNYDTVAVFGTKLDRSDTFPDFVYQELDRAAELVMASEAPLLTFCGSRPSSGRLSQREGWEVARSYVARQHPRCLGRLRLEKHSTSILENWLLMKVGFPDLRRILLVTIQPLLERIRFVGDHVYGDDGILSFEALPWPEEDFPRELIALQTARCIMITRGKMERGNHRSLLYPDDSSRWRELKDEHKLNCPYWGQLHPS